LALVGYEVALLAVAVGFPFAARAVIRARTALADQLLAGPRVPALDGLAAILRQELSISERTVGAASAQLFRKLALQPSPDVNRRVLAVLALLRQ
jgi:hypothetical protein